MIHDTRITVYSGSIIKFKSHRRQYLEITSYLDYSQARLNLYKWKTKWRSYFKSQTKKYNNSQNANGNKTVSVNLSEQLNTHSDENTFCLNLTNWKFEHASEDNNDTCLNGVYTTCDDNNKYGNYYTHNNYDNLSINFNTTNGNARKPFISSPHSVPAKVTHTTYSNMCNNHMTKPNCESLKASVSVQPLDDLFHVSILYRDMKRSHNLWNLSKSKWFRTNSSKSQHPSKSYLYDHSDSNYSLNQYSISLSSKLSTTNKSISSCSSNDSRSTIKSSKKIQLVHRKNDHNNSRKFSCKKNDFNIDLNKTQVLLLGLFMESGKFFIFQFDTINERDLCFNALKFIVQINKKTNSYPDIEYAWPVNIRFKPKENTSAHLIPSSSGMHYLCLTQTELILIQRDLKIPKLVLPYQFVRQSVSRKDGQFRVHTGRASPIGECEIVFQLADRSEATFVHTQCVRLMSQSSAISSSFRSCTVWRESNLSKTSFPPLPRPLSSPLDNSTTVHKANELITKENSKNKPITRQSDFSNLCSHSSNSMPNLNLSSVIRLRSNLLRSSLNYSCPILKENLENTKLTILNRNSDSNCKVLCDQSNHNRHHHYYPNHYHNHYCAQPYHHHSMDHQSEFQNYVNINPLKQLSKRLPVSIPKSVSSEQPLSNSSLQSQLLSLLQQQKQGQTKIDLDLNYNPVKSNSHGKTAVGGFNIDNENHYLEMSLDKSSTYPETVLNDSVENETSNDSPLLRSQSLSQRRHKICSSAILFINDHNTIAQSRHACTNNKKQIIETVNQTISSHRNNNDLFADILFELNPKLHDSTIMSSSLINHHTFFTQSNRSSILSSIQSTSGTSHSSLSNSPLISSILRPRTSSDVTTMRHLIGQFQLPTLPNNAVQPCHSDSSGLNHSLSYHSRNGKFNNHNLTNVGFPVKNTQVNNSKISPHSLSSLKLCRDLTSINELSKEGELTIGLLNHDLKPLTRPRAATIGSSLIKTSKKLINVLDTNKFNLMGLRNVTIHNFINPSGKNNYMTTTTTTTASPCISISTNTTTTVTNNTTTTFTLTDTNPKGVIHSPTSPNNGKAKNLDVKSNNNNNLRPNKTNYSTSQDEYMDAFSLSVHEHLLTYNHSHTISAITTITTTTTTTTTTTNNNNNNNNNNNKSNNMDEINYSFHSNSSFTKVNEKNIVISPLNYEYKQNIAINNNHNRNVGLKVREFNGFSSFESKPILNLSDYYMIL